MVERTAIEWADHTFNPWEGCQKVGPGCDHCYAEARNARFAGGAPVNFGPSAPRRRTSAANWQTPFRWQADASAFLAAHGRRQRVFCASLADVFDNAVERVWRQDLALLILKTPDLDWLLLTKRIGNAAGMLRAMFGDQVPANVWLGATIVSQGEADRDIPKLLATPAARRFLSMEPLLGPVDISWTSVCVPTLDWVIVGGESGRDARPMHPDWARSLRDQCADARIPFLFKQWGEWLPEGQFDVSGFQWAPGSDGKAHWWMPEPAAGDCLVDGHCSVRVGKKTAGRNLDEATHDGVPA